MFKIARVWHFAGRHALPEGYTLAGPYELTLDDLDNLLSSFSVLLYRDGDDLVLALDDFGKRFQQR